MKPENNITTAKAYSTAHPSLALIKYWGKQNKKHNIPATPSLAVTLEDLKTETTAFILKNAAEDRIIVNGKEQDINRYKTYLRILKKKAGFRNNPDCGIYAESISNFPPSAGLASSSSGFAALTAAVFAASEKDLSLKDISKVSRLGSASAARSVYGGFTVLRNGALSAEQLFGPDWWKDFRVIIMEVSKSEKKIPSREAMNIAAGTSPCYKSWLKNSRTLFKEAINALENKDIEQLGPLVRTSYLRMFSTMFSSAPPVIYWEPLSLEIIKKCSEWRESGLQAWETMDAGPQVKIFTIENQVSKICSRIKQDFPDINFRISKAGGNIRFQRILNE